MTSPQEPNVCFIELTTMIIGQLMIETLRTSHVLTRFAEDAGWIKPKCVAAWIRWYSNINDEAHDDRCSLPYLLNSLVNWGDQREIENLFISSIWTQLNDLRFQSVTTSLHPYDAVYCKWIQQGISTFWLCCIFFVFHSTQLNSTPTQLLRNSAGPL